MTEPADLLTDVLDRAEALCASGLGTQKELAEHLSPTPADVPKWQKSVSSWINRDVRPNGNTALAMQAWVGKKEVQLSQDTRTKRLAYGRHVKAVREKRGAIQREEARGAKASV